MLTLSLESILYPAFYRTKGIRRLDLMPMPPLSFLADFDLPKFSVLHFVGDGIEKGPKEDNPFLKSKLRKGLWVDHKTQLTFTQGNPRFHPEYARSAITDYSKAHPNMRWLKRELSTVRDGEYAIVENYALLKDFYVYHTNMFSEIHRFVNLARTVVDNINSVAAQVERQQFLPIVVPDIIPPLTKFQACAGQDNQLRLKQFPDFTYGWLLELWRWIGEEHRAMSVFGNLTDRALSQTNLIFVKGETVTVLNMGLLNDWRKDGSREEAGVNQISPERLQKRFLAFLLKLEDPEQEIIVDEVVEEVTAAAAKGKKFDADDTDAELLKKEGELDEQEENDLHEGGSIHVDEAIDELIAAHDTALAEDGSEPSSINAGVPYIAPNESVQERMQRKVTQMVKNNQMSAGEYKRMIELSTKVEKLHNPLEPGVPLSEFAKVTPEMMTLNDNDTFADIPGVIDKSMMKSTLIEFDKRYVENIMDRHVVGAILAAQKSNTAITSFEVSETKNISSHFRVYSVGLTPAEGKPSTVKIKVPVVKEDGTVLSGGVKYYLKKQRGEMPIRKTSSTRVALSSYYGKVFVDRSDFASLNYSRWISNKISAMGLDIENTAVQHLRMGNVFDSSVPGIPRIYSTLAARYIQFTGNGIEFYFNYKKRHEHFGPELVAAAETTGHLMVGTRNGNPIVVSKSNEFYELENGTAQSLGTIEDILDIPTDKIPVEMATMTVFNKNIPVGLVLAREIGLSNLIATLGAQPRIVPTGKNAMVKRDEFKIKFKDVSLVFSKSDTRASMILSGLRAHHRSIAKYDLAHFDSKDVYANILDDAGIGARYLRELSSMFMMFIDNITNELLLEMGEPTDMVLLILRAVELLQTDFFNEDLGVRIKGYERIAGAVFAGLSKAIRDKQSRPFANRSPIDLHPEAVWMNIMLDSSMEVYNEINPVQNLKQKEVVTFGGTGGRSTKTMVKRTRGFRKSDEGIISEATVDSGDVGIITYMSADPKLTTLYGTMGKFDKESDGKSRLLSTSALLSPSADHDDPKRTNFVSIQNSHTVATVGYIVPPVITGYEQVMAQRTDDLFAYSAKKDGEVISVNHLAITVKYDDGSIRSIELGRRFGKAAGITIPHTVITNMKKGDRFKRGDILTHNQEFFDVDPLNPTNVMWKQGLMAKTAFIDSMETYEDSCVVSSDIGQALTTFTSYPRNIIVNFDQKINNLVSVGETVEVNSILCAIENAVTADAGLFDETTIDTLQAMSNAVPKANHHGKVEKITVIYNGDIEDMHPSLQEIAMASDRLMGKMSVALGEPRADGRVDETYRIEGKPLNKKQLAIVITITSAHGAGVGDKVVFQNQLKSVIGGVMIGINETAVTREPIQAKFSYQSVSNRIVRSPEKVGTTNTLLRKIASNAISLYRGRS